MTKHLKDIFHFLFSMTVGAILIYDGQVVAGFLMGVMYQLNLIFERLDEIKRKLPTNRWVSTSAQSATTKKTAISTALN